MITRKMKRYLESIEGKSEKSVKHCVYINRMQKRITRELDMLLWLAIHYPDLFLDEEREQKDDSGKIQSHRRLKKLLLCVKALNPNIEAELVLKNLEFPEEE